LRSSLREVAIKAGVSNATVSRVLNNTDVRIAPETRQRVRKIAADLGYQPNPSARSLVTGRTDTIALCITNLRSQYSARVIAHALEEILPHEYEIIVTEMHIKHDGKADTPKLLSLPVDGFILSELPHGPLPGLEGSLLWGKPFVNIGVYVVDTADFVHVNLLNCGIEAIRHLHTVGCRRIAYLVPDWLDWFRERCDSRLVAYETGIEEIGQPAEFIRTPHAGRSVAGPALKAHIEQHGCPDGLFCYNDEMAVGALRALRELGLRIPEDVALIGCDGITEMEYHNPPVTTIVTPMREVYAYGWKFLQQRIANPELPLQQIDLQPHLEIRASSQR